jgi:undecaprenyl-diphosphatase
VVQGLTEFLPVSSSGHLVLAERLLGVARPGLVLETALHLGTLLAVLWAYRRDLAHLLRGLAGAGGDRGEAVRLATALTVGSLPAAVAGLALRGWVDRLFGSLTAVGLGWCGSGLLLLAAACRPRGGRRLRDLRLRDALYIGILQALALLPGVSRAGSTLAGGILRGLEPEAAARWSLWLSIPAVAGAALAEVGGAWASSGLGGLGPGLAAGAAAALLTGTWAIGALLRGARAGTLTGFGYYCLGLGCLVLLRGAVTGQWR